MPYRLQKNEPFVAGLKRIAEEQVSGAIQQLQNPEDLDLGIYQARKCLKRARSVLRLLAPQLGPIYLEENRRMRDVARHFSDLRDAKVSIELLDAFAGAYKRKTTLNPQRKALIDKRAVIQRRTNWQTVVSESVESLEGTRRRIEDWPIHHLSESLIEAETRKTHKQSRQAFERARKTRTAEDFHEFRKSVKRELNQLRLFEGSEDQTGGLKELAEMLGDHHNLAVLLVHVENASVRFRGMVQRQMRGLEARILGLGSRLSERNRQVAAVA